MPIAEHTIARYRKSLRRAVRRVSVCVVVAAGVLLAGISWRAQAQQPKASEFQVKAAYLYNFGRFVEWPDRPDRPDRPERNAPASSDPFEICVLGADPFGPTLDATLARETIAGKSVAAKRISRPQDIDDCRILFISSSEQDHLKEVLMALDKASVLTVSDIPRFSQRGGMIGFILDGNRVRFDVNLASAQDARLTLSSELLKVAMNVRKDRPGDF